MVSFPVENDGQNPQNAMAERSQTDNSIATVPPPPTMLSKAEEVNSVAYEVESSSSVRGFVGEGMDAFTEIINSNLIAARFGVFAGVCLLTAYGVSNTPFFFRFRTVSEVPVSYFEGRKRLYGRIIGVDEIQSDRSLQVYVRHLSPIGQILPKTWFDFFMGLSPRASRLAQTRSEQKPEENKNDLLKIRIAGIQAPPVSQTSSYRPEIFLEQLAKQRVLVSCQLLGRRVPFRGPKEPILLKKREAGEVLREITNNDDELETTNIDDIQNYNEQQVAVCRLSYRPSLWQIFPTDVAERLIAEGSANTSSSIMATNADDQEYGNSTNTKIIDSSQRIQDLRYDVKYLDDLENSEFEAAKKSLGMWSVPEVREIRREVVEEVEFQTKANFFQKVWRRLRGG